jgi:hypothetical protein
MVTLIPDMRTSASFMPMMAMAANDGTFIIGEVAPRSLAGGVFREFRFDTTEDRRVLGNRVS